MTFTPILYYSPGAVSLVSHIALEELGIAYKLEQRSIPKGEHKTAEYQRIHSLQRVPALEVAEQEFLTETPAVLAYLARLRPELKLLPDTGLARARGEEWLSFLASGVHPAFIAFFGPRRFVDDEGLAVAVSDEGRKRFWEMLEHAERRVPAVGYLLGADYTLCDTYLAVMGWWAKRFEHPIERLPRLAQLAQVVKQRPAAQRALEQEGLLKKAIA